MRFRLTFHVTAAENKFEADRRHEYLGSAEAIWELWFLLKSKLDKRHVEVFNTAGDRQAPEKGLAGLRDFSI